MGFMEAMQGPIGVAFMTMVTVLVVVGGVALCRKLCCKPSQNYTPVNHHGLDEEEIAFKNSLEAQAGEGDDIDELFNFSGQDELEFDTNDLDNLEMLQMYRTNLGAPPSPRETGLGKDGSSAINGDVATNGGGGGGGDGDGDGHGRSSNGVRVEGAGGLAETVQEAEDLEALLTGQGGIISGMAGGGASHPTVEITPPA